MGGPSHLHRMYVQDANNKQLLKLEEALIR